LHERRTGALGANSGQRAGPGHGGQSGINRRHRSVRRAAMANRHSITRTRKGAGPGRRPPASGAERAQRAERSAASNQQIVAG